MLVAVLARQTNVRAVVGLAFLFALAVFAIAFLITTVQDSEGVGCARQLGGDYLLLYANGRMVLAGRAHELYDLQALRSMQLEVFGKPLSDCVRTDLPVAYLPVFLVPYALVSFLSPRLGFLVSSGVTIGVFALALFRLAKALGKPVWPLWLFGCGSVPILLGINHGQVHGWLFLAISEFYIAVRKTQEQRAGLWLVLLLLKYQFLPIIILFLVWHRRWRVLRPFAVGAGLVLVASIAMVGRQGFGAYVRYLASDVAPVTAPQLGPWAYVNWRAFVLLWLPVRDNVILVVVTIILSLLTIGITMMHWRVRPWDRQGAEGLPCVLLSLSSASLLVGYDTAIHSAVLALAPGLATVASLGGVQRARADPMPWILDVILVIPSLAFMTNVLARRDLWLSWVGASQVMIVGMAAVTLLMAVDSMRQKGGRAGGMRQLGSRVCS